MTIDYQNELGLPLFQFETLRQQAAVAHAVSTRLAPRKPLLPQVQPDQPDDYRLAGRSAFNRRETIYGRRTELLTAMGLTPAEVQPNLVGVYQKHTATVLAVGPEAYGAELNWDKPLPDADGLLTDQPGIPLMTIHADCPPILLYDPQKRVVGAIHSGWRGTVGRIGQAAVRLMTEQYGSQPENILAGIGPSIGPCCYQVGEPVLSEVGQAFPAKAAELLPLQPDGSYHFDLWLAIQLTLLDAGLSLRHIENSGLCTRCHQDKFFSYRATPDDKRENYGQFVATIALR